MITEEQRKARKYGIGGSEVAAICGENPYKTCYEVWLDKVSDEDRNFEPNFNMKLGSIAEPLLVEEYIKEMNFKDPSFVQTENDTFYHKDYPYLFGNIDGRLADGGILEAKLAITYGSQRLWKQGIPAYHKYQVAFYRWLYDAPYVDVTVMCMGEKKSRIYRYAKNPINFAFEEDIINQCHIFWNEYVIPKKEPPRVTKMNISEGHASDFIVSEYTKVLDDENVCLIDQYIDVKNSLTHLTACERGLRPQILSYLGNTSFLTDKNNKIIMSNLAHERTSFDSDKFKTDHPVLYKEYCSNSTTVNTIKIYNEKYF